MCRHRVIVLIAVHFMVMAQGATLNTVRRSEPELSFVENIYVRLSGACEWLFLLLIYVNEVYVQCLL